MERYSELVNRFNLRADHVGRVAQILIVFMGVAILAGCVERKLTIKSSPSNARLYVNYDQLGYTPAEINFSHYGTRSVRLEKPGYKTELATFDLQPTWYSYFPINFITEVLLPFTIVDHREREFKLTPYRVPARRKKKAPSNKRKRILERAEKLRRQHPSSPSKQNSSGSSEDE